MISRRSFIKTGIAAGVVALASEARGDTLRRRIAGSQSNTVDLRDYLDGSGMRGTNSRNNRAIAALLEDLQRYRGAVTVRGHEGDVYRISGDVMRTFTGAGRLKMDGATFQWEGSAGKSSPVFVFSEGWEVEGMSFCALDGSQFRRLIDFAGGNLIRDVRVWAESQTDNSGKLLDYAVRILRNGNQVKGLTVENIDKAVLAYGADGDGRPGTNNSFVDIEIRNYLTGFELRNMLKCRNVGFRCSGRSANATEDPGHNGLLHSGVAEYDLVDFVINDSGEHGCRFGGTRYSEQPSRDIRVTRGQINRSGQSGLKFFTGTRGQRFHNVDVSHVDVVDCQFEPERPRELPGFNDEAFLIQQVANGTFSGLSASRERNRTGFSSDCILYISGAQHVSIDGLRGSRPRRNFIRISQWDDGAGKSPVEPLPNDGIQITNAHCSEIGEDGIFVDHPTMPLRNLDASVSVEGSNRGSYLPIKINSRPDLIRGSCEIEYQASGFRESKRAGPDRSGVQIRKLPRK